MTTHVTISYKDDL